MTDSPPLAQPPKYNDGDLVYVDPETRTVIGKVEFNRNDKPKSLAYTPPASDGKDDKKEFRRWRKFYPWGTYKSMKRVYKVDGKLKEAEPNRTLEEVLPKALNQAFWND